ncbi:hypothetical protein [Agrococcus terreus]|uniref:Uncharacterized protein n=1 Tax=Agrococcus terreus TaxID=574649 RepID=A0ABQ2KNB7_9MICO|nr:hypothetical protein [Agrococcus terreus]GGN87161.1 hypothetical protein GCM10010968_21390 [Agrococcus terreus]
MVVRADEVVASMRMLLTDPERRSHIAWVWGGASGSSAIVVYRWLREPQLLGFERDVEEYATLFAPIDSDSMASILAVEIEEPGARARTVPEHVERAVPAHLRALVRWSI